MEEYIQRRKTVRGCLFASGDADGLSNIRDIRATLTNTRTNNCTQPSLNFTPKEEKLKNEGVQRSERRTDPHATGQVERPFATQHLILEIFKTWGKPNASLQQTAQA